MKNHKVCSLFLIFFTVYLFAQNKSVSDTIPQTTLDSIPKTTVTPLKNSETAASFEKDKIYELGGIKVTGLQKFEEETVKVYSGLITGQLIRLPGDKLSSAIKKLYLTDQFKNIDVFIEKIDGNVAYLDFRVIELPQINEVTISGKIRKNKRKDLLKEAGIKKGDMLTENLQVTTVNFIKNNLQEKGYYDTKVTLNTKKDTASSNLINVNIHVDKGNKIKIKDITFKGHKDFSSRKLRRHLKKTKKTFFGRFWKKSKYVEADFKEDLAALVTKYSEKGYRDARVINHNIVKGEDNTLAIHIDLEEGKKYIFGDINFIGNISYTDQELQGMLRIEKGDSYNGKVLKERITGDGSPNSEDISSLYYNSGYLFSRVIPVETRVQNDTIDVEIRIHEDQQTTIRKVEVHGNQDTYDHVIHREIKTKPGYLFSKRDITRSVRELGQLGFFDPESISPELSPNYIDKTVDLDYSLVEKGSSQVQLQGGYGGGSFIGTVGLALTNFSLRNLFNKEAYKNSPIPLGDGQTLSLNLQKSRFYTTSSFSFIEPWLGGKKPVSFSFSVYNSIQYGYNYQSYDVDKDQKLSITGASISLGKRLKRPDNYFQLSQQVSYQQYALNSYSMRIGSLFLTEGNLNNLSYTATLSRNASGINPIFPTYGSDFSASAKFTFPYSLVNGKDYDNLELGERYKWLEYYKLNFTGKWYTSLVGKFVLASNIELGYLGHYSASLKDSPFERFYVGGDGLSTYQLDGRQTIALRGYENSRVSSINGGTVYNKFQLELRYPISLKPSASIYALSFLEAGNSYDNFSTYNPFIVKRSAGFGLRVFMQAFGLLGIDFAYGFDPLPGSGFNGQPSGWQTHFILNQRF